MTSEAKMSCSGSPVKLDSIINKLENFNERLSKEKQSDEQEKEELISNINEQIQNMNEKLIKETENSLNEKLHLMKVVEEKLSTLGDSCSRELQELGNTFKESCDQQNHDLQSIESKLANCKLLVEKTDLSDEIMQLQQKAQSQEEQLEEFKSSLLNLMKEKENINQQIDEWHEEDDLKTKHTFDDLYECSKSTIFTGVRQLQDDLHNFKTELTKTLKDQSRLISKHNVEIKERQENLTTTFNNATTKILKNFNKNQN